MAEVNEAKEQAQIGGSMRPDGSRRKVIRTKPGYVSQDDVPKYNAAERRKQRLEALQAAKKEEDIKQSDSIEQNDTKKSTEIDNSNGKRLEIDELSHSIDRLNIGTTHHRKCNCNTKKETSKYAERDVIDHEEDEDGIQSPSQNTGNTRGKAVGRGRGRGRGRKPKYTLADLDNGRVS